MKKEYPYLHDDLFLHNIINSHIISHYINVTLLDWEQNSIKSLQGKIISANINIDGKSAIRRTANISMVIDQDGEDAISLLNINKKIAIEIGYLNETSQYTDFPILWFPFGIFVITGLSLNHSLSNTNISLTLKDKMCLLNGQCGGVLPAAVVFDNYEVAQQEGQYSIVRPTIYQIITELVNHYGGEQLGKIIISDLDTRIKQMMTWTGDTPLYFLQSGLNHLVLTDEVEYQRQLQNGWVDIDGSPFMSGSNVGFIFTDFSYPGDLIGNAGDTVVTILDKIKNVLGNFEYFYDIDGNFRFQEIKNYLNNSQSKYVLQSLKQKQFLPEFLMSTGETYILNKTGGKAVFSFKENPELIVSYSNTPNINNIKNDFVVWGLRKSQISNTQTPIRYHLAIDNKPQPGNIYKAFKYVDPYDENSERWYVPRVFASRNNFPIQGIDGVFYLSNNNNQIYKWGLKNGLKQYILINATIQQIKTTDWRTQLYFQGIAAEPFGIDSNYYFAELLAEWPKIYDIANHKFKEEAIKSSDQIDYYLDFISPSTPNLQKISVQNIGRRSCVLNKNNDINCVFEQYTPDIVLINNSIGDNTEMSKMRQECQDRGQNYTQISGDIYDNLSISSNTNSAYEQIKKMLYQYINYAETISIQTIPIYFLQPNTIIELEDKDSHISGNYIINSLSFNLDVNGTMSINASKLLERI